jgi:nickel/cobalt exporter
LTGLLGCIFSDGLDFTFDSRASANDSSLLHPRLMNSTVLTTLAITGFVAAFGHATIPTHWLPFVLVGRTRGWSRAKTLAVALFAGSGHILTNTLLGLAIAWFGFQLDEKTGRFFPWVIGGLLVAIGLYFGWRQWRGGGICHHHPLGGHHHASEQCGHEHDHSHWEEELKDSALEAKGTSDWTAIGGLFVMLTLSPCEAFLPVYLSGVKFGWEGFFVLSAILAVATLTAMMLFTWLTLCGFEKFQVKNFERYEAGLLSVLFIVLGILIVVLESLGLA